VFENTCVLAGVISKEPAFTQSPAGIPHCQFVLEHQSQQIEADLPRRVWCKIKVIASGAGLKQQTEFLKSGINVRVTGFITRVEGQNGLSQLVLHARQINRID
jgi:primosomal replication protein N